MFLRTLHITFKPLNKFMLVLALFDGSVKVANMSVKMGSLLEFSPTLAAREWPFVEVHHVCVSLQCIIVSERFTALIATEVFLLQVNRFGMLVHVPLLAKASSTKFACVLLALVRHLRMLDHLISASRK